MTNSLPILYQLAFSKLFLHFSVKSWPQSNLYLTHRLRICCFLYFFSFFMLVVCMRYLFKHCCFYQLLSFENNYEPFNYLTYSVCHLIVTLCILSFPYQCHLKGYVDLYLQSFFNDIESQRTSPAQMVDS